MPSCKKNPINRPKTSEIKSGLKTSEIVKSEKKSTEEEDSDKKDEKPVQLIDVDLDMKIEEES